MNTRYRFSERKKGTPLKNGKLLMLSGLIALSLFLSGCEKIKEITQFGGGKLTKVTLLSDWYPQAEHGGFYMALVNGYYKEVGLDVDIIPGGLYAFTVQRVANGEAQFGMAGSVDILLARERDDPVVSIAATMQRDPQAIMMHDSSPVRSFEDLDGRVVYCSPGAAWAEYVKKKFNLLTMVTKPMPYNVDDFVKSPDFLQQVFVTSEPYQAEQRGTKPRVLLISASGYRPYRVIFGNENFINQNSDVTKKFVQATIRGWEEYLKEPAPAHTEILKRNPNMTLEFLNYSWGALKEYRFIEGEPSEGERIGSIDPARWQEQYEILRDLDIVKSDIDPMSALSTDYF